MLPGPLHAEALTAVGTEQKEKAHLPLPALQFLSPCMKKGNFQAAGIVELKPTDFSSSIRIRWVWSWQTVS